MVLPSCLLDDGHWVGQIGLFAADPMDFCDHPLELGEPGPLLFPGVASSLDSGSWILDSLPSDIRHLIHFLLVFTALCSLVFLLHSAFCRDNHVCCIYMIVVFLPFMCCVLQD